jgi:hypothetical protein
MTQMRSSSPEPIYVPPPVDTFVPKTTTMSKPFMEDPPGRRGYRMDYSAPTDMLRLREQLQKILAILEAGETPPRHMCMAMGVLPSCTVDSITRQINGTQTLIDLYRLDSVITKEEAEARALAEQKAKAQQQEKSKEEAPVPAKRPRVDDSLIWDP